MLIQIEHALRFEYDDYIHESFMELRVQPLTTPQQTLRSFYMAVGPPTRVGRYTDWNGNTVHSFGISDFHDRIEVLVRSAVATDPAPIAPDELRGLDAEARAAAEAGRGPLLDFATLGGPVQRSPELERLVAELPVDASTSVGEQVVAAGRELFTRFEYRQGVTDYRSTTQHILDEGGGVCQDFAHLMLGVLRLRGIPCRYVSGYLHVETGTDEPSQSHAWIEAYVPGRGWIPYDPTHDLVPDERYVLVARGRHYDDVSPNRGIYRGRASETLHASVTTRIAPPKDIASLHEEIGQLDVPVHRDQPQAKPERRGADVVAQQQQ